MCSESFRTHPVFNVMLIRFEFSCIHWCNFFCSFDELNTSEYEFYDFTKVPHWKMKSNQNICISVIISMSKIDLMTCAINVSATSVRIILGIKKKNTHTHLHIPLQLWLLCLSVKIHGDDVFFINSDARFNWNAKCVCDDWQNCYNAI